MTSILLEKAIAEVRKLPEKRQNEAAEILLGLVAQDSDTVGLTADQIRNLRDRLNNPKDVRATADEVSAVYRKLDG